MHYALLGYIDCARENSRRRQRRRNRVRERVVVEEAPRRSDGLCFLYRVRRFSRGKLRVMTGISGLEKGRPESRKFHNY